MRKQHYGHCDCVYGDLTELLLISGRARRSRARLEALFVWKEQTRVCEEELQNQQQDIGQCGDGGGGRECRKEAKLL